MSDLVVLPAIDIRDGTCVRLLQGSFAEETVYGDPSEQAKRYVAEGAEWLHVVDLDAARRKNPDNRALIAQIIATCDTPIEIGGGIRSMEAAAFYLNAGAARVIVGSAALEAPQLVESLVEHFPSRIGLGLDHRQVQRRDGGADELAVRGWEQSGGWTLEEALLRFASIDLAAVIVTDISRDGTLSGPDLVGYRRILGESALPLIASGGIKGPDDLVALSSLSVDGRSLCGAVVGKALLSGAMSLKEAMAACAR